MLPRTIDKARAILARTQGEYEMPGLSTMLLDELKITEDEFFAIFRDVPTDDDIATWLTNTRPKVNVEQINAVLLSPAMSKI